ncbi:MAG TPA: hypothetical protein PLP17_05890 [Oligoflexia bacterium]|nr:hypothetical protein [Oligoflexia bacterium]
MKPEDDALIALLQQIFNWKHNSLAAYITGAEPYVRAGQKDLLKLIMSIGDEDRKDRDRAAELMHQRESTPRIEPYPHYVADLNYLSLDYLAAVLTKELSAQQEQLTQFLTRPGLPGDTQAFLQSIAARTARQLETLAKHLP